MNDPWRGFRFRLRLRWVAFFGWIPGGLVTLSIANAFLHWPEKRVSVFMVPFWLSAGIAMIYAAQARCPRCGEPFYREVRSGLWNTFTKVCLACGQRRFAPIGEMKKPGRSFTHCGITHPPGTKQCEKCGERLGP